MATCANKGHGRRERRTLWSTTWLDGYLDWPGVGQVFLLWRERTIGPVTTVEESVGITSLSRDAADAATLLRLSRGHWGIENGLHWVRDVTLGEDACRVRSGSAPQVLAALRNVVVYLLGQTSAKSKAGALRRFAAHPRDALALVRGET